MEYRQIIFPIIFIVSVVILTINLKKIFSYLKVARDEKRSDNIGSRIAHMFKVAIGQTKIFRDKTAGPLHAAIFWGFLILLFCASESVIQGFYPSFNWSFLGPFYWLITLFTDIFNVLIIVAIIASLLRRYVFKVKRLQGDKSEKIDALIVLGMIFIIVGSLMLEKAAHIASKPVPEWAFCPISTWLSSIFTAGSAPIAYEITWWIHILGILFFANYLPFSKHLHVYTSIQNVFFSPKDIPNSIEKMDFEDETLEKFGVVDIDDLSWKNLFDSYSCTHCGRCADSCPANITGKELSPREIIVQIRERTIDAAPIMLKMKQGNGENEYKPSEDEQKILEKKFVGDYESVNALWQCTTCGACMQECPLTIEHVPTIIGMRRNLVMMEADFPAELQPAFNDLENNFSPWAFPPTERADWAEGMNIKTCAENPDFDVLFWVGCAGSFDDRAKKVSRAFAKLMQIAGVNFAILGEEEKCNGDPARRAGNEYLADMLVNMNVETLNNYNVKKIVTFCPHCFNTFKNEYPDFGGNYEVVHHSQFLAELIKNGKLKFKQNGKEPLNLAFHDSCYLGRYNQIYKEPREVLKSIPGSDLREPKRNKDKGFCCGAGGARMFMEETEGKPVNNERTEELIETGADKLAVNCPFCLTMMTDGLKAFDKEEEIKTMDIAEILLERVEGGE